MYHLRLDVSPEKYRMTGFSERCLQRRMRYRTPSGLAVLSLREGRPRILRSTLVLAFTGGYIITVRPKRLRCIGTGVSGFHDTSCRSIWSSSLFVLTCNAQRPPVSTWRGPCRHALRLRCVRARPNWCLGLSFHVGDEGLRTHSPHGHVESARL